MPVQYSIDHAHSLVRLQVTDPLDLEQIAVTVKALLSDSDLRAGLNLLSDHSELDFTATTDLVRAMPPLLAQLGERLGQFRCAVVVPRDASFGMARMAEVFAEDGGSQLRGFRSIEEAEEWLSESSDA